MKKKNWLTLHSGLSLTELLIAMVLISFLLLGTFYMFSNFFASTLASQKTTVEQSDIQVASQFIKWDILMTGYGLARNVVPITITDNSGENNSDIITLRSTSFGLGGDRGKWTYIMQTISVSSNLITVRRWNNEDDIDTNDYITILSPLKTKVGAPVYQVVAVTETITTDSIPALILQLNQYLTTSKNFVFASTDTSGYESIVYSLNNGSLLRNDNVFLEDIADFQMSLWIDDDGDRRIDSGERYYDTSPVYSNPALIPKIRLTKVVSLTATQGDQNYRFGLDSIKVENNVINTDAVGRNKKYDLWESNYNPRNF